MTWLCGVRDRAVFDVLGHIACAALSGIEVITLRGTNTGRSRYYSRLSPDPHLGFARFDIRAAQEPKVIQDEMNDDIGLI